ncbi:hypothetical protein LMG29660_06892 [Burkholderia puraquae]|uniref:Uncharacterized protein n=1 Tax=Burkholderia puraquae TaxID=1904757 RepID=A0A6J5F2A7_9BURK|nr:hypothetical protein LMG29660_06892 [Burkholderia puraquae]
MRSREDADLPRLDVGCAEIQPDRTVLAQRVEVDLAFEHFAQRIQVVRIELIRRENAQHHIGKRIERRMIEPEAVRALQPRRPAQRVVALRRSGDRLPEIVQCLTRAVLAPLQQPVREYGGVHCAGAGRTDTLDVEPAVFKQPVEHAPGERAVHPAPLQRQRDLFARTVVAASRVRGCHARLLEQRQFASGTWSHDASPYAAGPFILRARPMHPAALLPLAGRLCRSLP